MLKMIRNWFYVPSRRTTHQLCKTVRENYRHTNTGYARMIGVCVVYANAGDARAKAGLVEYFDHRDVTVDNVLIHMREMFENQEFVDWFEARLQHEQKLYMARQESLVSDDFSTNTYSYYIDDFGRSCYRVMKIVDGVEIVVSDKVMARR